MLDPMPTFGSQRTTTPSRKTGIPPTLLWIGCGSCSGESMAILGVDGQATDFLDLLEHDRDSATLASLALAGIKELERYSDRITAD